VLRRGKAASVFRSSVDPVSVYLIIAALGLSCLSNRHMLSTIFARKLTVPEALTAWGEHIVSVTLASIRA